MAKTPTTPQNISNLYFKIGLPLGVISLQVGCLIYKNVLLSFSICFKFTSVVSEAKGDMEAPIEITVQ